MTVDQWLKLDAYFLGKPLTLRLAQRYGPAGVLTWLAFLSACKRNHIQGRISYATEQEARQQMMIDIFDLVDPAGQPWTLDDFFGFTGRMKQTRVTTHGRVKNVRATHWEQWQNVKTREKTLSERERKRRSRAKSHTPENESEREKENESADVTSAASLRADATSPKTDYKPAPPNYPEWQPSRRANGEPIVAAGAARALLERIRISGADPAGTAG